MGIPSQYLSWNSDFPGINKGGWYYGEVAGSYSLTKMHYFKPDAWKSVCDTWYPSTGIYVFGPVHRGNIADKAKSMKAGHRNVTECLACKAYALKNHIPLPNAYGGSGSTVGPLLITVTQEIEIAPDQIAFWVMRQIEDYISDFVDDEGYLDNDGTIGDEVLEWIRQRLS